MLRRLWWADWRSGLRVDIFLIIILAAGLCLYTVYRTWAAGVGGGAGTAASESALPADAAILEPAWMTSLADPTLRPLQVARAPLTTAASGYGRRQGAAVPVVARSEGALRVPVLSPWGTVEAWGLDDSRGWLPLSRGSRWRGSGDLLVPAAWITGGRTAVGRAVRLTFLPPYGGPARSLDLRVSGSFPDSGGFFAGPVLDFAAVSRLSGYLQSNVAFVWQTHQSIRFGRGYVETVHLEPALRGALPHGALVPKTPAGNFTYLFPVQMQLLTPATTQERLGRLLSGAIGGVGPAVLLMFLSLFIAVTVGQVVRALDQRERLGIYKATGIARGEVFWLNTLSIGWDVLLATALAALALIAGAGPVHRGLGVTLRVDGFEVATWVVFGAFLARWGGRIAASLFDSGDAVPLLRKTAAFDWWSLIRF